MMPDRDPGATPAPQQARKFSRLSRRRRLLRQRRPQGAKLASPRGVDDEQANPKTPYRFRHHPPPTCAEAASRLLPGPFHARADGCPVGTPHAVMTIQHPKSVCHCIPIAILQQDRSQDFKFKVIYQSCTRHIPKQPRKYIPGTRYI